MNTKESSEIRIDVPALIQERDRLLSDNIKLHDLADCRDRLTKAESTLESLGWRRCDIAACNCGGYHRWSEAAVITVPASKYSSLKEKLIQVLESAEMLVERDKIHQSQTASLKEQLRVAEERWKFHKNESLEAKDQRDNAIREMDRCHTEHDKEIGAFQNEVRELVIKLSGAPDDMIDGKRSDAGWQEFLLDEISQGFAFIINRHQEALELIRDSEEE